MQDSIVAPATPNGRGGIAIVRISGPKAKPIGLKLCNKLDSPWKLKKTNIYGIKKNLIDSGLVVFYKAPSSYTGEDVVEIHCHGSPIIVDLIIEAALVHGARVARAGEFTERAFINQKIDLTQAESVADLISSESKEAAKMALSSLRGGFSKIINETIDRVVDIRVGLESGIDFPEEETGDHGIKKRCSLLGDEILKLKSLLNNVRASSLHREGFKASIIGPPNSGKSTLINFLSQDDASIVSRQPGTTRDPVKRKVNIRGFIFELVDTAGIRKKPSNEIEKEGILRANKEVADSDLILNTCPFNKQPSEVKPTSNQLNLFTKCDLDRSKRAGLVGGSVYVSGKTGAGIGALLNEMLAMVGANPTLDSPFLARRRHITSLKGCLASLELCLKKTLNKEGEELCAEILRDAQSFLGEITRPHSSDDLLGEIFSRFCIGK